VQPLSVLAVQDEGTFDFIDVTSMMSQSHILSLPGISKSYKTRMTQRAGGLAIADTNGFFFADMVADTSGRYSITLQKESFNQGTSANDFVEFKRETFFVTFLETDYFAIVERSSGGGFFSGGKMTKIRSISPNVLSMGIQLIPGPRLNSTTFVLVRDRRGIQLVNLLKGTSHQLMMSPVPVQYTDLSFLRLLYDPKSHLTHLVTLFYEAYPAAIRDALDTSSLADREGNKPVLCLYTFNREFQSGLISLAVNSTQDRTLY